MMKSYQVILTENDLFCLMIPICRNDGFLVLAGILLIGLFACIVPVAADSGQAWFDVSSNPSGAWACLDGWNCADTPITFAVDPSSYHSISVYKDGYEMWRDYVGTGSDRTTTMVMANIVQSAASVGWLDINAFGADIWIDGTYYGNGVQVTALSPGSHNLLLQKAGYYDYKEPFTINAGQTLTMSPGMTAYTQSSGYGDLQIQSDPAGAAVFVNNNYEGTTSSSSALYVTQLIPGSYSVRLTLPDYQPYTETAVVRDGIIYDIHANMVPVTPGPTPDTTGQINVGSSPAGANIYLDNAYRGITPLTLANIPQGSHIINLKMNGYQDWTSPVNVVAGSYAQVSGTLSSGQQPNPPAPTPQPTRSPLNVITILSAIGICGAVLLIRKRE
jgi:hypothetical protein